MGYSPEDIEKRREEEKTTWVRKGFQANRNSNVNSQIEEALIGNKSNDPVKLGIDSVLPDSLIERIKEGKLSCKTYIEWFASGLVSDFLDDWHVRICYLGFGTSDAKVSLEFSPKKKTSSKKQRSKFFGNMPPMPPMPPLPPMPDVGKAIDETMRRFDKSMEAFNKQMDEWSADLESWTEELAADIENKDDPEVWQKWKDRGIDLNDVVLKNEGGNKSISIKKHAVPDFQAMLKRRRDELAATLAEKRRAKAEGPKREPTRVAKKIGGIFSAIGEEIRRCKVKLGLEDPPASEPEPQEPEPQKSERKTHPVEVKD